MTGGLSSPVGAAAPDGVSLWRCDTCGKWSHAVRRPKVHTRFVRTKEVPDDVAAEDVVDGMEEDTGAWVSIGYRTKCGPFSEYRATRVSSWAGEPS